MMKNQLQKTMNSAVTAAITSLDFQGRTMRKHLDDDGNTQSLRNCANITLHSHCG